MEAFHASLSGLPLLQIVGDVDHFTAPALEAAARESLALDNGRLLLDLTAVPYLDSAGADFSSSMETWILKVGWASSEPTPISCGS